MEHEPPKDDEGESLFDRLTAKGRELVPVSYRFLHVLPADGAAPVRLAESKFHRATGYVCWRFHRPISKCRSDVP